MTLINKDKVLHGVGKAVDAANNTADKVDNYIKENEIDKKAKDFADDLGREINRMGRKIEDTVKKNIK